VCIDAREVQLTSGPAKRRDGCPICHSDLKCCLNCRFFDPHMEAISAASRGGLGARGKDRAHFCEAFPVPARGLDAQQSGMGGAHVGERTELRPRGSDSLFKENSGAQGLCGLRREKTEVGDERKGWSEAMSDVAACGCSFRFCSCQNGKRIESSVDCDRGARDRNQAGYVRPPAGGGDCRAQVGIGLFSMGRPEDARRDTGAYIVGNSPRATMRVACKRAVGQDVVTSRSPGGGAPPNGRAPR